MSKPVMFRTSLAGYNKKDVNDYIRRHAMETQAQLEEQKQTVSSLSKRLASCEEQAQGQRRELKSRLGEEVSVLSRELVRTKAAVQELLEQLTLADLQVQNGQADAQKAKQYDALAQGLGQLLNLELKAEESVFAEVLDRSALKASVTQSLQGLSDGLSQLQAALHSEE